MYLMSLYALPSVCAYIIILCSIVPSFTLPHPSTPVVDTIGTIIANNRAATASRPDFLQDERDQLYHIVKPDESASGEGRGKIISEVFLTRLLSTKVRMILTDSV